jgi:hypothetical protein
VATYSQACAHAQAQHPKLHGRGQGVEPTIQLHRAGVCPTRVLLGLSALRFWRPRVLEFATLVHDGCSVAPYLQPAPTSHATRTSARSALPPGVNALRVAAPLLASGRGGGGDGVVNFAHYLHT